MLEREIHWPPRQPPKRKAIGKAWARLHDTSVDYLKRTLRDGELDAFLETLTPAGVGVELVTEDEYEERWDEYSQTDVDLRPVFGYTASASLSERAADEFCPPGEGKDGGTEEGEGGDLAMIDEDAPITADTRFKIWMELQSRTSIKRGKFGVSDYVYRQIAIPHDVAMYLVSMIGKAKKTVADALIFKLLQTQIEEQAEDEGWATGTYPEWRERTNDPAMDVLTICTQLQELYVRLVEEDGTEKDPVPDNGKEIYDLD